MLTHLSHSLAYALALVQDTTNATLIETTIDPVVTPPDGAASASPDPVDVLWNIWDAQLFNLNDTPIRVSQIIIAIAVLVLGSILARRISARVGHKVLPRFKIDRGAANTIQSILYYCMLAIAVLVSLQIAGVPLAALTFFGGALALGIGFGSQNVINNFISGLILMIERPIRVGDRITINDQIGTVLDIGTRATKIESYFGSTYIVPNSIILENSVTNWHMPDATLKSIISVGVAYGSDTGKVRELLQQAMDEHAMTVKSPQNKVMFTDFGSSSLDFEVHCSIKPKNTFEKNKFESDTRFRIDELFREHDIEIPFPQRDLHIKPNDALRIQMLKD